MKKRLFPILLLLLCLLVPISSVSVSAASKSVTVTLAKKKKTSKSTLTVGEKLTIKAAPLGNGLVKAKTGDDTNDEVYLNWYNEVYLPNAVIGGEAEFIAMQD